jgi:hypothetical protein
VAKQQRIETAVPRDDGIEKRVAIQQARNRRKAFQLSLKACANRVSSRSEPRQRFESVLVRRCVAAAPAVRCGHGSEVHDGCGRYRGGPVRRG